MKKTALNTKISTITIVAILTLSTLLIVFPSVLAQDPPTAPSYPFIGATPNPVQAPAQTVFEEVTKG